jgi:hypothetical protein
MDLLTEINQTLSKNKVEKLALIVAQNTVTVKEVIDLTFHQNEQVGFRAAWILENLYTSNPDRFLTALDYFLSRFAEQQNRSAQRHFTKLLALITHKKAPVAFKNFIPSYNTDELVEAVFALLIDEKTPVAVKSHCLNILANLVPKHSWIKEELIQTMDYLTDKESIAFFAKVKQIRKQLKKY